MSATFTKELDNLFVVNVQEIFTFDNLKEIEKRTSEQIDRNKKIKLLVLAEEFSGWDKEGDWGDVTFMNEYDPYIEKIAVVTDEKWKDQFFIYLGVGIRQASVEFFLPGQEQEARSWLQG